MNVKMIDTLTIRQKLHDLINNANDQEVKAIYESFTDNSGKSYEWSNDDELLAELERRSAALKSGEDPGFSLEESRAHLMAKLNKNG